MFFLLYFSFYFFTLKIFHVQFYLIFLLGLSDFDLLFTSSSFFWFVFLSVYVGSSFLFVFCCQFWCGTLDSIWCVYLKKKRKNEDDEWKRLRWKSGKEKTKGDAWNIHVFCVLHICMSIIRQRYSMCCQVIEMLFFFFFFFIFFSLSFYRNCIHNWQSNGVQHAQVS